MKRSFTKLIAAIALLVFMTPSLAGWGQVESGTTYSTLSTSSLPTGWSGSDGGGTSYIKLTASSHYIQTSEFGQNGFTSIKLKARKFGGPTDAQALITVSWYYNNTETVLGTITPSNTNLTDYTISSPTNPTGNTTGYIKIQCKGASNSKGSGVSAVTITYTAASGGDTPTTYTVTFDAGDGTFVGNTNFPYANNTVEAGTYTLPSATPATGYTFNKWNIGDQTYDAGASYTVSGNADFVASYTQNGGGTGGDHWVLTELADLTADDVFVIVGNNGSNYAMSNDKGTSAAPTAVAVTVTGNEITSTVAANLQWNISGNATNGYTFYPNGSTTTWLYCTSTNNGVRVGTNSNKTFGVVGGYLKHSTTNRYVGIYNSQDWRCYTSYTGSNIADQTFAFYKKVTGGVIPPSITANNVNIAYDATSGEIAFTLNNPATNGSLSVSENVDWISNAVLSTTESKVTFTTTANEATTAREGIITITYTYGDNETVSKDVTVTQAAAPLIYTTIPDLFAAATGTETDVLVTFNNWVVSGVSTNGKNVFVTDNNGNGFVIFDNDGGLDQVYSAGNILSGTAVSCTLKKYNGFAELLNVTATDLTITSGGTVTVADVAMTDLAGVNTGALLHYDNLTCSVTTNSSNNTIYNLSDGTTTLQVYNALYAFGSTLENDKTYNITGVYQQYNNTKEILPRSAADIEEVISAEPSVTVTPNTIDAPAAGANGSLTITYENLSDIDLGSFDYYFCDAEGEELQEQINWIDAEINEEDETYVLDYTIHANDGDARTVCIKVYTYDEELEEVYAIVTVNQARYVVDYATLPFEYDGNGAGDLPDGFTVSGVGTYNSSPAMKFDGAGDYAILKINERPGTLTFDVKGNPSSGSWAGTFKVQTSVDGVTYTDLETYANLTSTVQSEEFTNLGENVRYIKWIYTEKTSGNVALGNITLAPYAAIPTITVNPATVNVDAISEEEDYFEGTLDLTWENLEISDFFNDFAIQYYDAEGEEVTEPDWIMADLATQEPSVGEGYLVSYVIQENESDDARTAYFKVFAEGGDDFVYSNLVTITQAAYVAPGTETTYAFYEGDLVEGDYIIYYDGYAMKNTVDGGRLSYETVTPSNNVITTDDATIVWHIAQSGGYWTIYSADAEAYAAGTGAKSKAQMLADGTDDKAKWTVSGTYEFVNKANEDAGVNANLRNNGTYGFACYANTTGGALSLYKKVETFTLDIDPYIVETGTTEKPSDGWYLIASPVSVDIESNTMSSGTYDLYRFNPTADKAWENYKNEDHSDFTRLEVGRGYLYATGDEDGIQLSFTGVPSSNGVVTMLYEGWNLVGNPLSTAATITDDYYRMNETRTGIMTEAGSGKIDLMEGVFVQATEAGQTVIFNTASTDGNNAGNGKSAVVMNLSQNRSGVIDRAIVRFGNDNTLPKFQLFENSTKLYIPQNGEDFAIVNAEAQGEMPVNFKASENGTFTISFSTENVEMSYLHLIDNIAGQDIDLIQTPSYTFNANTTDYASRFRLVFSGNGVNEDNDNFAFISNGQIILTGDNSNATLQVVDMLGRVVSSQTVNGNSAHMAPVANGVYVLRLINGNDVKTQKIVVK